MAVTPNSVVTPQTPFSRAAATAAANTDFVTTPTTTTLLDRADNVNGARITRLLALPRATLASASNCQIYAYDGTTKILIDSALMATVTPGASVANAKLDFGYSESLPLLLRAGWGLEIAPGQAVSTVFRCEGGFY